MALVAIAMVAIIAMAAMSIDLVTLYLARQEAQRSADAAALAAARIISVSGITGLASAPSTNVTYWQSICGPSGVATVAAQAAGGQNSVAITPATVNVTYSTDSGGTAASNTDCSALGAVFTVNPLVTVQVQRTNLPSFFSRIWGNPGNSISATAIAEAFNPSASDLNTNGGPTGAVTPVQPRCVKPWMVPNQDPWNQTNPPRYCNISRREGTCQPFVSTADGSIQNPGISTATTTGGVIGETFNLFADCVSGSPCTRVDQNPQANVQSASSYDGNAPPAAPNLEYLPGQINDYAVAVPKCAGSGGGGVLDYEPAVAGCDQSTQYQCGVQSSSAGTPNYIDLTENPGGGNGDTATGLACSLTNTSSAPPSGQDILDTTSYPFQITAGASNPWQITSGTPITASNSIVSLPIYDSTATLTFTGNTAPVTIVGFLQVFINSIDSNGNISVTVLNVSGCGNGSPGTGSGTLNTPVTGSSPVPVRLITPP